MILINTRESNTKVKDYWKKYYERNKEVLRESKKLYYEKNRQEIIEKSKNYFQKNKLKVYERRNKKRKITVKYSGKPNKCEICHLTGKICLDHNHITGEFRGWICDRCNKVLGFVKDDKELLIKLSNYLKNQFTK